MKDKTLGTKQAKNKSRIKYFNMQKSKVHLTDKDGAFFRGKLQDQQVCSVVLKLFRSMRMISGDAGRQDDAVMDFDV